MQKKKFIIYRRDARKGSSAYSPKPHSAPHFEGHYVEGMEEWASHYCFNKRDDGKYEAELDEAWNARTYRIISPLGLEKFLLDARQTANSF